MSPFANLRILVRGHKYLLSIAKVVANAQYAYAYLVAVLVIEI